MPENERRPKGPGPEASAQDLATTALRTMTGQPGRYEMLHDRNLARAGLHGRLFETVEPGGVEVRDVEIRDLRRGQP